MSIAGAGGALLLLAAFAIILSAAVTQALTGFGFALVAVPLLAIATDPRTAVVATAIAGLLLTVTVAVRESAYARWRTAALLFGSSLLGMPLGLLVLRTAPERMLAALIAVGVLGCTLLVWRGLRLRGGRGAVVAVGVVSGVLATSTGTNGPPLVAAFQALGYDPRTFRATLSAVFAGTGVTGLAGFAATGQVSHGALSIGLLGLPAVLIGWWGGNALFQRVDEVRFRRLVLGALVASAAVTLARALAGP